MSFKGNQAEEIAKNYLLAHGLTWVTSHFQCRMGEIDLIMRDNNSLVFVEVRFRQSSTFGSPHESITMQKQKKLWATASYYLSKQGAHLTEAVRFDVVCLLGTTNQIEWIQDAIRL